MKRLTILLIKHLRTRFVLCVTILVSAVSINPSLAQTSKTPTPPFGENAINVFLTAELLSLDQQYELAATTLWPLARFIKDPELFERMVQWGMQAKRVDIALAAIAQWETSTPNAAKPQQLGDGILLTTERYAPFTNRLVQRYQQLPKPLTDADLIYLQRLGRALNLNDSQRLALYKAVLEGLKTHEDQGAVQYTFAVLAYQAKLAKEGQSHMRAASLAQPSSAQAIGALLQDDPAQATLSAIHWTQRDPSNVEAWRTLGLVHARLQNTLPAIEALNQGLKIAPSDVSLLLERSEQLRFAKQANAARDSLLAAHAAKSSLKSTALARILAEQLEDDYFFMQALEVYALAVELASDPDDQVLATAKQLSLNARRGDSASLARLLKSQSDTRGEVQDAVTKIALTALRELNEFEPALRLIDTLPNTDRVYEQALTFELMGKHQQAETLLRQALRETPNAPHLLNLLGYGLVERNASPAALQEGTQLLEAALAASPNSAAIMDSLGWAYFRAKQYTQALPLLQTAYDLKRDPEVAAHLGELFWVTGDTVLARKIWNEGVAIDPKHKILTSTLKRFNIHIKP